MKVRLWYGNGYLGRSEGRFIWVRHPRMVIFVIVREWTTWKIGRKVQPDHLSEKVHSGKSGLMFISESNVHLGHPSENVHSGKSEIMFISVIHPRIIIFVIAGEGST